MRIYEDVKKSKKVDIAVATINKINRFSDMEIQHLLEGKKSSYLSIVLLIQPN